MILAINLTSNTFLVSGGAGGTGKFLGIIFESDLDNTVALRESDCSVSATKVRSEQVFLFNATDNSDVTKDEPISLNKVGAGTVLLEAEDVDGWVFVKFNGDDVTQIDGTTSALYKPVKYGTVEAIFEKESYTITVTVESSDPIDYVETEIGIKSKIYNYDLDYEITGVIAGSTPVFNFVPDTGNHISLFKVNAEFKTSDDDSYTFKEITDDQWITVYFSKDGEAYIPKLASGLPISLGDDVTLNFDTILEGGTVTQEEIDLDGVLKGSSLLLWNIGGVDNLAFTGTTIALPVDVTQEITITRVFTSNNLEALYSDVNLDGEVTNADVNAVAIALATNGREYDKMYDVNMDKVLNSTDIQLVHDYVGTTLEELDFTISLDGTIIYITTGHFSFFRCR